MEDNDVFNEVIRLYKRIGFLEGVLKVINVRAGVMLKIKDEKEMLFLQNEILKDIEEALVGE